MGRYRCDLSVIRIPHLETDLTVACQLSCVSCNHMVPMWRKHGVWRADKDQIKKDLFHLSSFVHADRWGALGGEPLLHPNITHILRIVKGSGICDLIEVWTNGLLLQKMPEEFWYSPLDIIVLSRYEGKLSDEDVEWIADKCHVSGFQLEIKDERTWRNFRTNLESIPTDPIETKSKYDGCFFKSFSRVANNGYFYTCCCSPHMPRLLQGRPEGSDGIAIEGLTEEGLQAYLTRSEPLGCCTVCAGRDTAKAIEWSEERDPQKWLEKSKGL